MIQCTVQLSYVTESTLSMVDVLLINKVGRTIAKLTQRETFWSPVPSQDKDMQVLPLFTTSWFGSCNPRHMQLINYVSLRSHIRLSAAGDHAMTFLLLLLSIGSSISIEFDLQMRMMSQHTRCPNKGEANKPTISQVTVKLPCSNYLSKVQIKKFDTPTDNIITIQSTHWQRSRASVPSKQTGNNSTHI